jgi:hypothetical protein
MGSRPGGAACGNPRRGQDDGRSTALAPASVAGSFGPVPDTRAASTCRSATQPNARAVCERASGYCTAMGSRLTLAAWRPGIRAAARPGA